MSDITNPGLVNVADQAFKPDLKVDSLAIPLDDDVLVPVADQDIDPVTGNPLSVTFPTPAEAIVSGQAPGTPSQDFATIPGQPPLYLPFPPAPSDPRIQAQSVTAGIIAEITVGPGMSIQTNLTPAVVETYTVTSVLDADTLQPVVVPTPPIFGIFSSVWGTGGVTTVVSPLDMTGLISDGQAVILAAQAGHPTDYDGVWTISNLLDLSGTFDIAITGGAGKTILGSSFPIDGDLGFGKRIAISGSPIAAYNGNHALLEAESIGSNILSIMAGANPLTTSTVVSELAVGLVPGQLVRIINTGGVPPAGYDGYWIANNVINLDGSIQSIANGPPTKVTVNLFGSTTGLVDGQIVTLSQTLGTAYNGQYPISNVTPTSFDIVHAFAGSSTGNWTAYTFDITTPFTGTPSSPSELYDSNTITIDVPFAGWSPGTWSAGTPFAVGTYPVGVAISPDGTRALVTNNGDNNVTPLSDGVLLGAPHTNASLTYVSSTPITGAVEDWLSAHGSERGCIRQDGEDGEAYRARVRMIPDAVSPLAIARAVDASATALPERWLAEPFNDGADPSVKLAANLGFFDGVFCDSDFCDDPLGTPLADKQPVANLECSGIRESRAYVRVDLVGQLREPDGSVLYCDDGFCDDPQWGYPDIGTHPAISGAEQALLQEVQGKLAGGVQFDVYLENSTALVQQGSLSGTTGIDGVPVITLMPVDGTAWYLREGLLTADMGPTQHWTVTGQGIAVRLTLDDGTILQTPWAQGVVSLRSYELEALGYRGQRVTSIEGWGLTLTPLVPGSPGNTMNLIGSFTVNTCTL
ncbi:MAG: hypothetical protein WCE40_01020 [Polyangia bacterium]